MAIFSRESALLEPVTGSMRRRGYSRTRSEVQFFEYSMDLYGYAKKPQRTSAVELKLTRWRRAFEQALIYQLCADFVYVALPMEAAQRVEVSLLVRHGIGLMGVDASRRCIVVVPAQQSLVIMPSYRDLYVSLMQETRP
jgi:hypothetical protein